MDRIRLDVERSLALHTTVAERVLQDPVVLERARAKVDIWLSEGGRSEPLLRRWQAILGGDTRDVVEMLQSRSEEATQLRKASPFAGVLTPRERLRILREVEVRLRTQG